MPELTDSVSEASSDILSDAAQEQLVALVVRGMIRGTVTPELQSLVDAGLAVVKGPLVMPMGEATSRVGAQLRLAAGSEDEAKVRALYEAFLPLNRRLRDLCTDWQCRPDGRLNDHADPAYDAAIRDRLDDIHDAAAPLLERLTRHCPRLDRYRSALDSALERFDDGETSWLASPLIDSYHTVWMHVHQELLLALAITRADDEALEAHLAGGMAR